MTDWLDQVCEHLAAQYAQLPRCKHPLGSQHEWIPPVTGATIRCRKCDYTITLTPPT